MAKRKRQIIPGDTVEDKPRLNEAGQEVLNDTPVSLPVRYQRGENITERVQRMVEETISRRAASQGFESVDEANDFYVEGDDYFPTSEHEIDEQAEYAIHERESQQPSGFFKVPKGILPQGNPKPPKAAEPADQPTKGSGEEPKKS